ncbi:MAG TPA: LytTR family DNA-binding domain-containing protein [Prolixibacteraceae bacterium]|nr:LytTR family DNA-binding domain-containing protein [Prolixibacteraceae bacterium]
MIRTVLIDDEVECRMATRLMILKYCPELEIVGEADGVSSGLEAIERLNPDLVMLDIQMQDGTGFEFIVKLEHIPFSVIFITSYDQFALKAFQYSALDYLLKPLEAEMLIRAVHKATHAHLQQMVKKQVELHLLSQKSKQRLALPTLEGLEFINMDEIVYCESDSNYTTFHLNYNRKLMVSKTMKEYEELFPEETFMRIHKSYIVNLLFVSKYLKGDGGDVVLSDGTLLPVARLRKERLLDRLKML